MEVRNVRLDRAAWQLGIGPWSRVRMSRSRASAPAAGVAAHDRSDTVETKSGNRVP